MAYRRRPGTSRPSSTFADEVKNPLSPMNSFSDDGGGDGGIGANSSSPSSLAAKAIRASSAHTDSSLSSAYGYSNLSPASRDFNSNRSSSPSIKDPNQYEYTSMKSISEPKQGLWSALTRKAKSILDENNVAQQSEAPGRVRMQQMHDTATGGKYHNQYYSHESREKLDSPTLQKGLGAITSSLNYIGGTIGNAVEEGLTIVENKTADIIQETRKHIRKKSNGPEAQNQETTRSSTLQQPQMQLQIQTDQDIQLKASRDVRWQLCITGSYIGSISTIGWIVLFKLS